jgi:putative glutamine amidotransferase
MTVSQSSNAAPQLVGVSAGFTDYGEYIGVAYSAPLAEIGAIPVVLPYTEDPDLMARTLDRLDGLLLGFGRDLEPGRYGAEPHPAMTEHSPVRDAYELALAREALDRGMPILGICRGMQILNVALGGTLYRDRSEYPAGAKEHPGGDWDRWDLVCEAALGRGEFPEHPEHPLEVARTSLLASALGTSASVNSYHHQAVDRLGSGVRAVAWAPDGIVEALEVETDGAPVLGVQWELQESWRTDRRFLELFRVATGELARSAAAA